MDKIIIEGGLKLNGEINVSGAKNAALPIMTAALLTEDNVSLSNVPNLTDISFMAHLLIDLGMKLTLDGRKLQNGKTIILNAEHLYNLEASYDLVSKMRASIWVLGPLLARFRQAKVALPGGCAIGTRQIDLHLKVMEAMGASISFEKGFICASTPKRLQGVNFHFSKVSVGATINALMASTLASGTTILSNAACEPEIMDLCKCLNLMGAKISGIGTNLLKIVGVKELSGCKHSVIPDRIEIGTYIMAVAMTGGRVQLNNIEYTSIQNICSKLREVGINIESNSNDKLIISHDDTRILAADLDTMPFPGFPTDLQAQYTSLMSLANGTSIITENIFENRFMHVPELCRMGANINVKGQQAIVCGVSELEGTEVVATDLRASACLVLAGLKAKGQTIIRNVHHLDRGYECMEEKLRLCGAKITRIREASEVEYGAF